MVAHVSISSNLKEAKRSLDAFASRQLPFATALAVTALAKRVQAEEVGALKRVFDRPTPFTVNSIGVRQARKSSPVATVFVKDVAASYLAPYEFGGVHKINGKAMLVPKGAATNQYGNQSCVNNSKWPRPTVVAVNQARLCAFRKAAGV